MPSCSSWTRSASSWPTGQPALFVGYPDPAGIVGEHLDAPPIGGPVVVAHLGIGLADVVFGDAILAAAEREGRGVLLPR